MKICWIGLGNMGLPMATHLHKAMGDVVGFDLSPRACEAAAEAGIFVAGSVQDAAQGADVLFTMLPKDEHVRAALLDSTAVAASAPGALVIDCSTIGADDACNIAAEVAAMGRRFLDAPVSGGTTSAQNATLTFMVGGASSDLADATRMLTAMGSRIFHAGENGAGQSAKIVNNMMLAMNMQSTCEAAALAQRLGIAPQTVIEIAAASTGDSWVLRNYYPVGGAIDTAPSSREFTGGFAATLMRKDLGLALDAAANNGVDAAATAEVARRLDQLIADGHGALDFSAIIRLVDADATTPQDIS